jgi:hypothetical protein
MRFRYAIYRLLLWVFMGSLTPVYAQQKPPSVRGSAAFFDSINRRIDDLEKQSARLRQARDVSYLNLQRELDHALFVKTYEEYVVDENLDQAKDLVEKRIERSDFRKDQSSLTFYRKYEDDVYRLIKKQRAHYQQLFEKEKNIRKEFDPYIEPDNEASLMKAQRMVNLALKYAKENNLAKTVTDLEQYLSYVQALQFDLQSTYDLAEITNSLKSFNKVFQPLISSDSLDNIKKAETLLTHCMNYGRLTHSSLDGEFFKKQEMVVTTAISDLLERQGREQELTRYANRSVIAKFDSLNPCGVFKWHDQIIVIDEFMPTASMDQVKKGEAILHADKMLATYLQKNKLCSSVEDLKFGYAFIIPYKSDVLNTSFFFNPASKKWQYIACYTMIVSKEYTGQISKFMPPLLFQDEMDVADSGRLPQ